MSRETIIRIFLVFMAVAGGPPKPVMAEELSYFPPGIFSPESRKWYQDHLVFMEEPSLWKQRHIEGKYTYRYLLIGVFADPVTIRIDIQKDLSAEVTVTKIKRSQKGSVDYMKEAALFKLSQPQVRQFLELFQEEEFWATGLREKTISWGGVQWVIEGLRHGQYHMLGIWTPEEAYPPAAQALLNLMHDER